MNIFKVDSEICNVVDENLDMLSKNLHQREFFKFVKLINYVGGTLKQEQRQEIRKLFKPLLDKSFDLEKRKIIAYAIFKQLDNLNKRVFCQYAYHRREVISKPVWSFILMLTHTHPISTFSLLSDLSLENRAKFFESADPKHLMDKSSYERFLSLPEEVTLYRGGAGVTMEELAQGMCWSTGLDQASIFATLSAWLAKQHNHDIEPVVIKASIKRQDIFASPETEGEVIIRPGKAFNVTACEVNLSEEVKLIMEGIKAKMAA